MALRHIDDDDDPWPFIDGGLTTTTTPL